MERNSSRSRIDVVALATMIGVGVMLAVSLINVWSIKQLAQRIATLERRVGSVARSGSDPSRAYAISTVGAPSKGPDRAPVTIVEFSDFQCPFCARVLPTLDRIQETYGGAVRLVWKHLPLPIHRDAVPAALAAQAAEKQGKFWEFHDKLFANQDQLHRDALTRYARELQLDVARFQADLAAPEGRKRVEADAVEARTLGVEATPGFFINGRFISGAQPFETFAAIIDEELAKMNIPKPTSSPD